jgi:hypothetical protein
MAGKRAFERASYQFTSTFSSRESLLSTCSIRQRGQDGMSLHEQLCCVPTPVETHGNCGMCASFPLLSMNSWAVGPITRVVRSTYLVVFWTRE